LSRAAVIDHDGGAIDVPSFVERSRPPFQPAQLIEHKDLKAGFDGHIE
jgi:hypothetical protein